MKQREEADKWSNPADYKKINFLMYKQKTYLKIATLKMKLIWNDVSFQKTL